MAWLEKQGDIVLPDVARATVEEALLLAREEGFSPKVIEVLQIRLRMARASNRKLARMIQMADLTDLSIRGQFQFNGAGRTGRWSGRGVQVQNLPRTPKGFSPDLFAEMARQATAPGAGALNAVSPAPVLDCVSWSLGSCLKATDDSKVLWSFDFSQIEARVLAWLAGQRDVLDVFASGEDVYVWAASQFGSKDRQLGKVLILALGFGMGAMKLRDTALEVLRGAAVGGAGREVQDGVAGGRTSTSSRSGREMEFAAKKAILSRGGYSRSAGSGVAFSLHPQDVADATAVGAGALLSPAAARSGDRVASSTGVPRSGGAGWNSGHGAASSPRTPPKPPRAT